MNRILLTIYLSIVSMIQTTLLIYAHPLDVSNTTLTFYTNSVEGVTYIHPVQLDRILVNSGNISPASITVDSYYSLTGVLTDYLKETIGLQNNDQKCNIGNFSFQEGLMIDEIFSGGFPISYTIYCNAPMSSPKITIRFLQEVPLQTNRLNVYRNLLQGGFEKIDYSVLNRQKESLEISLGEKRKLKDTDGDGISDEDELLYGTNPDRSDTDGDGYSDQIELQSSWNPLSKELSPGQKPYDQSEESLPISQKVEKNSLAKDSTVWGGERFSKILRDIRMYIDGDSSSFRFSIILFGVIGLGFLHALGPGHSKGILISQILDQNISILKGGVYSIVFSMVHIADIVFVVIVSRFFFSYIDPSKYISYIQQGSIILICCIGVYLLYSSIDRYRSNMIEDKKRHHIVLAIITGMTPCAFGWSIFLMLLAVGRGDLALPLLLGLGFGIFLCLFGITIVTFLIKKQIFQFSPKIGMLSPIISSCCILLIGFGLVLQNF